jgi:hypothetical protein
VKFDDEDAGGRRKHRGSTPMIPVIASTLGDFVQRMWKERLPDLAEQIGLATVTGDETRRVHLRLKTCGR